MTVANANLNVTLRPERRLGESATRQSAVADG
jgi:hypothetical protein